MAAEHDEIERLLEELYAVPPNEFVALRDSYIRQARHDGAQSTVEALRSARRPSQSAWLLNQVSRAYSAEIADLLAIGEQARSPAAAKSDVRTLATRRRRLTDQLVSAAEAVAARLRGQASPAVLRDVRSTLDAALVDEEVARDVRRGRLTKAASYAGFGPDAAFATAGAAGPRLVPDADASPPDGTAPVQHGDAVHGEAGHEVATSTQTSTSNDELEARLEQAQERLYEREQACRQARQRRDQQHTEVDDLTERLRAAEQRLAAAERGLRAEEKRRDRAQAALDRLRRRSGDRSVPTDTSDE